MKSKSLAVILAAVFTSSSPAQQPATSGTSAQQGEIQISPRIRAVLPANFQAQPQKTRNLVEIVQQQAGKRTAYISVVAETRKSHEEAVHRLLEIANEAGGNRTFTQICGWPGFERVYRVRLAHLEAEDKKVRKPFEPGAPEVVAVTIAAAESDVVVRFEGVLQPGAGPENTVPILGLGRSISCPSNPHPEETKRVIEKLKQEPLRNPSGSVNPKSNRLERTPVTAGEARGGARTQTGTVQAGVGELQIGVSADGRHVVVGANSGVSFSDTSGDTFAPSNVAIGFPSDGDPSLGRGVSGTFYEGFIGFPDGTPAAGNVNGCSASVLASTDNGQNFNFVGHAAFCPLRGGICFPDQPQIAVDERLAATTGDQLYMVWRNFPDPGDGRQCSQIARGNPTPTISCSVDGGRNWQHQTAVGTGDRARITVGGPDGIVYVTYVSGSNLIVNSFTSCRDGLATRSGFPVTIASFTGIDCPIPGLDRCDGSSESSPQPAVSKDFPNDIFVAYAEKGDNGNDNIVVRHSHDTGFTWPDRVVANSAVAGRRFLPWICTSGGTANVTWYDRRNATAANNSLTDYFWNSVSLGPGAALIPNQEANISGVADPECGTGFPGSVDNVNDATSCQPAPNAVPGVCMNANGGGSFNACNLLAAMNPACLQGESCQPGGGIPKYGDYNGNACTMDRVYMAWASATPPNGVAGVPAGINIFSNVTPPGPPVITAVAPGSTPCGNAAPVTITGANFYNVFSVGLYQGGTKLFSPNFHVDSHTQITATIPNTVPSGPYQLTVLTPEGSGSASFLVPPVVTGLSPASGPVTGGTLVTVNGSCLQTGMPVSFGGTPAAFGGFYGCPTTTQCVAYSPAVTDVGAVDVTAGFGTARSAITPGDRFSYVPLPISITSVTPSSGPITGGTSVQITVPNGPGTLPVSFGGVAATAYCSIGTCGVVSPPAAQPGPVDIIATAYGGSSSPSPADRFTYTRFPALKAFQLGDPFFGTEPSVLLNGNAPAGGALIAVSSSDPRVVGVPASVTIPAGTQSTSVALAFSPTPVARNVTLTATYQGSSVTATVDVAASPAISITTDAFELATGESATATVTINASAPAGGAVVSLSSSDPSAVAVPGQVSIPVGAYNATFTITNHYSGRPKVVTISAHLGGASASATLYVPTTPACRQRTCAKGYYWNQDDCRCEKGPPQ